VVASVVVDNSDELSSETNVAAIDNPPIPIPRPARQSKMAGYGYFYAEITVEQGDALEGRRKVVRRLCIPEFQMPEACYRPQWERQKFIVMMD
jgi:hypothetical protein